MALTAKARGQGRLACAIAALLMERDIVRATPQARDADLRLRIDLINERNAARDLPPGLSLDRGGLRRVRDAARQIERQIRLTNDESIDPAETGSVLALAYPDRIAQSRGATGQFRLASGGGAELPASDPLAKEELIFLAAPLTRAAIEEDFAGRIAASDTIAWDPQSEAVLARRQRRLDALVLDDQPLRDVPPEQVTAALLAGIRELGLAALPWSSDAQSLRARIQFLHRTLGDEWPDVSDAALLAGLEDWLAPYLTGITRRAQFGRVDLGAALAARLDYAQRRQLDALAPTHIDVPSGSRIAIDYAAGDVPVLAVKLQEMFGATTTPTIAQGKVPLIVHLLSPAGRPLQVTRDLATFWKNVYPQVRGEMRGRYPKHPWPDDPLTALPTARTKRRS
jgi:ATP-dependent helicase HrpB